MSSQSLFKAGFVKLDADAVRVINSNDRISQKLESLREMPSYPDEIMEEEEAYMDEAEMMRRLQQSRTDSLMRS